MDRISIAETVRRRKDLAKWLADNHASADGKEHSEQEWEEWIVASAADAFFGMSAQNGAVNGGA